jgi:16S rRNA (cytosine967-C5)-methyltransferase
MADGKPGYRQAGRAAEKPEGRDVPRTASLPETRAAATQPFVKKKSHAPRTALDLETPSGFRPYLLTAAQEALFSMMKFDQPADGILSAYFKSHSKLGQRDRAFVAESAFGVLRHRATLEAITPRHDARALVIAWLARFGGRSLRDIAPVLSEEETEIYTAVRGASMETLPVHVRAELPEWVVERLSPTMSEAELLELGRALQTSAPLDLRVNTLRAKRDDVLARLNADGLEATATPYSPIGIRLAGHPSINRHPGFLEGDFEVQDEGSQLIGYLVAPKRTDLVIDFCTGAGGKALMLGAMMQSKGRLYAFDVSSARVARLGPRLRRSGLSNLHPEVISSENDTRVKRLAGKVDRVLVDAPCSGFGTLRRNPDLRYRHSPVSITELVAKQTGILRAAARLVRPGGRLVYATCSLLPEENQAIVDDFLAHDPSFALLNAKDILARSGIDVADQSNDCLQLWPHHHRTDGFFAAVLEKKAAPVPAKVEEGAVKQGSVEEARDKGPDESADIAPAEAPPVEAIAVEAAPVEAAPVEAALKEEASADEAPAEAAAEKAPPKVAPRARKKRPKKA